MNLEIFEKSRELGELLVASEEYRKVQQAEEAFPKRGVYDYDQQRQQHGGTA